MINDLKRKRLFLLDMDGTIYKENLLFDGTLQLLSYIKAIGGHFVFITNNSSKSVIDYVEKVNRFGINADFDNFYTSTQATSVYLANNIQAKHLYCMGTRSMVQELQFSGFKISEAVTDKADAIVVGFDTELTSGKLRNTCEMLKKDIPFIATNPDLICPVSFGFIPDCGSICQMLKNATGREPSYMGKPSRVMADFVMKKYNFNKEETVIVGDRLYTDIATGINAEITSILVLTGEAKVEDLELTEYMPTYTFESIKDLFSALV